MMKALNFTFAALTLLLGLTSCLQSKLVSGDQSEDPGYTYNEETNTYTVYTVNGLLAWNKAVQDDLTLNCTLAADIDLTGINYEWLLVGSNDDQYTGTFEGGGYTLRG